MLGVSIRQVQLCSYQPFRTQCFMGQVRNVYTVSDGRELSEGLGIGGTERNM
jgi:hypothetical protein